MSQNKSEKLHFASIADAIKYQDNEVYKKLFKENETKELISQIQNGVELELFRKKLIVDNSNSEYLLKAFWDYNDMILLRTINNLKNKNIESK